MIRPSASTPHRFARGSLLAALAVTLLCSHGRDAHAASPYRQTSIACSNGDQGDDRACKRLCRSLLDRKGNPLGDLRSTCLRRLDASRNILTDPD